MLLPEHEKYHKLGPVDCKFQSKEAVVMSLQVTRQTSATGEQIAIEVPIYHEDSREDMMNRINMAYSIMQERMEDENKALMKLEEQAKARKEEAEKAEHERKMKQIAEQTAAVAAKKAAKKAKETV